MIWTRPVAFVKNFAAISKQDLWPADSAGFFFAWIATDSQGIFGDNPSVSQLRSTVDSKPFPQGFLAAPKYDALTLPVDFRDCPVERLAPGASQCCRKKSSEFFNVTVSESQFIQG